MSNIQIQLGLKANEEACFQRKNRELLEKLKEQEEIRKNRRELSRVLNTQKEELLDRVVELGFSSETARLIWLVPLVYVAWSDHSISDSEAEYIVRFGSMHGMLFDEASRSLVNKWLKDRPSVDFFDRCHTLLCDLNRGLPWKKVSKLQSSLESACAGVADSTGGILGFGSRTSKEESNCINQLRQTGLFDKVS